uniref:Uncharacterized protein n=1 Tax=Steinernema glaseri TaxID=37863 RepID=A0A1I7ZZ21_9BILA
MTNQNLFEAPPPIMVHFDLLIILPLLVELGTKFCSHVRFEKLDNQKWNIRLANTVGVTAPKYYASST